MASHALSNRRVFKGRPDVCNTFPNPGRCEPPEPPEPPFCECGLIPPSITAYIHEPFQFDVHACRNLPGGQQDLTYEYSTEFGTFGGPPTGLDCQDVVAEYMPWGFGTYWVKVLVTWTVDGHECTLNGSVTVKPY